MENLSDYIDVFTTAPLAVIVLVFIYMTNKQMSSIILNMNTTMKELVKILKQIKRK